MPPANGKDDMPLHDACHFERNYVLKAWNILKESKRIWSNKDFKPITFDHVKWGEDSSK